MALGSLTVSVSTTVGPLCSITCKNGATFTNGVLSLAPANVDNQGIVTKNAQTIVGVKTFSAALVLSTATVSQALLTDANKNVVSNALTGIGNLVVSNAYTGT